MKISVCFIMRDEEKNAFRVLSEVKKFADEIIVVDTGSNDKTKEIAEKFTNYVYNYVWHNNFSEARNYAFSLATSDYLAWFDADDDIPESTIAAINNLKKKPFADVYYLKYEYAEICEKPVLSFYRERIVKNCAEAKFEGRVHESIAPFGKIEYLNASVKHLKKENRGRRNLNIYLEAVKNGEQLTLRDFYYMGKEYFYNKNYKSAQKMLKKFIFNSKNSLLNVKDALLTLYKCDEKNNVKYLFKALEVFGADAEIVCNVGDYFRKNGDLKSAAAFYENALKCEIPHFTNDFVYEIYYNYYPLTWLTNINYELKQYKQAKLFAEKCIKLFPADELAVKNMSFFIK